MRVIIQLVEQAKIEISEQTMAQIGYGLAILVAFGQTDDEQIVNKVVDKIVSLRLFPDHNGQTNLSLDEVDGSILLIPNFTLYGSVSHGRRPSFSKALGFEKANHLFEYMIKVMKMKVKHLEYGQFGANMKISFVNDGPFTICFDDSDLDKGKL